MTKNILTKFNMLCITLLSLAVFGTSLGKQCLRIKNGTPYTITVSSHAGLMGTGMGITGMGCSSGAFKEEVNTTKTISINDSWEGCVDHDVDCSMLEMYGQFVLRSIDGQQSKKSDRYLSLDMHDPFMGSTSYDVNWSEQDYNGRQLDFSVSDLQNNSGKEYVIKLK